jgi:hypothetical protein
LDLPTAIVRPVVFENQTVLHRRGR